MGQRMESATNNTVINPCADASTFIMSKDIILRSALKSLNFICNNLHETIVIGDSNWSTYFILGLLTIFPDFLETYN